MSETTRYGREFGRGTLVGDTADTDGFFDLSLRDQARHMGWSNGCPVVEMYSDPNNKDYGPEKIRNRYAETNFWFGMILARAKELNPLLYDYLSSERVRDEEVGEFEPESVPDGFKKRQAPISTVVGYAAPRVLIEQAGLGEDKSQSRFLKALDILDRSITRSGSTVEFLAKLARGCINNDAEPLKVLSHVLSLGFLKEENCKRQFRFVVYNLRIHSSRIWEVYSRSSPEDRRVFNIASEEDFEFS